MLFKKINEQCIFIHIPKTGGNTVQQTFIENNMTYDKIVTRNSQDGFDRFEIEGEFTSRKHQTYRKYLSANASLADLKVYTCVRKPFERLLSFYFAAFRWVRKDLNTNKIIIPDTVEFKEKDFIDMVKKLPTCLFYLRIKDNSNDVPDQLTVMRTEQLEHDFMNIFSPLKLTLARNKTLFPELKSKVLLSKDLRTLVENSRSTTSGLFISIQEKENIIDDLVYQGLNDISNESNLLLIKYMGDFIL